MNLFGFTLDDASKLLQIVAILYAIPASYFKFIRGRIYHLRFESSVSATLVPVGNTKCLLITTTLKNVGVTKADIDKRFTVLEVFGLERPSLLATVREADWEHLAMYPALTTHNAIEAGESVSEQQLVVVGDTLELPLKINLHIRSKKTRWISTTIVVDEKKEETGS